MDLMTIQWKEDITLLLYIIMIRLNRNCEAHGHLFISIPIEFFH